MQKLFVYADFDWLAEPRLVGELTCDTVRGGTTYGFAFDRNWLAQYGELFLSEDLQSYTGVQYTRPGRDIFACFSDALPDRWGCTLLNRREQLAAAEQGRMPRRLSSFDYLTGIDDASRMGGFRFSATCGGGFINSDAELRVPPLTTVRELMHAAHEIEASEERHQLPQKRWLDQLLRPGSSLGGARPKASVIDDDGTLAIAKFPSRKDSYDVAQWEHFCHVMGCKAGIDVAATRSIAGGDYHILLSRRFDRTVDGRRIHFASALALLGLADGDSAATGYGYTDIADFIVGHGCRVEHDLRELYRRVAFNIIVGNSDDHFRNHGFLLRKGGWELSPAYDINPTLAADQSLLINRSTNAADLDVLAASAADYMLPAAAAQSIIGEVRRAMHPWRNEARRLGLTQRDIDAFAPRFDRWL